MKKYVNWNLVKESPKAMIVLFATGFFAIIGLYHVIEGLF